MTEPHCLRRLALLALAEPDPTAKVSACQRIWMAWQAGENSGENSGEIRLDPELSAQALWASAGMPSLPGRPSRPELMPPSQVPRRRPGSPQGHKALIHALAHIEFNAINLALDAVWRFPGQPEAYYRDWLQVAEEEAQHFSLLRKHLQALGADYGDLPAHDGLWEMAEKTSEDLLARMALVPRTLEARGLDASPAVRDRLAKAGDAAGAAIVSRILADEVGHVAIGNRWYADCCAQQGLDPIATYAQLVTTHQAPRLKGPFNLQARRAAGFDEQEIAALIAADPSSVQRSASPSAPSSLPELPFFSMSTRIPTKAP